MNLSTVCARYSLRYVEKTAHRSQMDCFKYQTVKVSFPLPLFSQCVQSVNPFKIWTWYGNTAIRSDLSMQRVDTSCPFSNLLIICVYRLKSAVELNAQHQNRQSHQFELNGADSESLLQWLNHKNRFPNHVIESVLPHLKSLYASCNNSVC